MEVLLLCHSANVATVVQAHVTGVAGIQCARTPRGRFATSEQLGCHRLRPTVPGPVPSLFRHTRGLLLSLRPAPVHHRPRFQTRATS